MAATNKSLNIVMFPWFAMGHLTPYLHLANKLARKGHRISFFVPTRTQTKLQHFNHFPQLITFVPISVPHLNDLPPGSETTSDVPVALHTHIMTAMDWTEPDIELLLNQIKPDLIFFDFTHWIPAMARRLGIKSVNYCMVSPVTIGFFLGPLHAGKDVTEAHLIKPPPGFPFPSIKLNAYEAKSFLATRNFKFGSDVVFYERHLTSFSECDIIAFRTCRETEGPFADYVSSRFGKPVLLSGPAIPEQPNSGLDERWAKWLGRFEAGSVLYCAFGSECILEKDQFQELLLGFELSGLPFFAALKPPFETKSVKDAFPEGFEERVLVGGGRGIVCEGWVQQQLILQHPLVGCFVTHCGSGSLSEALVNKCKLVLLPHVGDQVFNARMMSQYLKVGVEVEKGEEDGLFTKESVCKSVRSAMDESSEIGKEIKGNHAKLRDFLLTKELESNYIDSFSNSLLDLVS